MWLKRVLLPLILLISLCLSLVFASDVPYAHGLNPDETAHIGYIQLLIENCGLVKFVRPEGGVVPTGQPEPWESHQPPLYYLLCLPVYVASGGNILAVRLVSAALQLLTILAAFAAVRSLFAEAEWLALATAAFVAFLPTQARISGAVNNDALTTLVCLLAFWLLGILLRRGLPDRESWLLALVVGLGIWTKLSVLQLLPMILLAYTWAVRRGTMAKTAAIRSGVIALTGALVLGSPWLIRNTMLYGDPFAASIYLQTGPNFSPAQMMGTMGWSIADYARITGVLSFFTFWYLLPPNQIQPPAGLFFVILVVALGALLGFYRAASRRSEREDIGAPPFDWETVGFYALAVAILCAFFAKFLLTTFQAQGRYFLPVLLPVAIVTLSGWSGLFPDRRVKIAAVVAVDLILLLLSLLQFADLSRILKVHATTVSLRRESRFFLPHASRPE